jgi:hypothetical protein
MEYQPINKYFQKMNITIRKAEEKDSEKVWHLMKELAIFEKYINVFAITPEIVRRKPKSNQFLQEKRFCCV